MGTRGDPQALIGDAPGRLRTLRAALTTWKHGARVAEAHRQAAELAEVSPEDGGTVHDLPPGGPAGDAGDAGDDARAAGLGDLPPARPPSLDRDEVETVASSYVVVALPDRWRVVGRGYLAVSDGHHNWAGTSTLVTERDASRAAIYDAGPIGACLTPQVLLGGLELTPTEVAEIEGRRCLVVEASLARPARGAGHPTLRLLRDLVGIDHRVWLDAATGIVLRHEGSVGGEPCATTVLTDLVFDEPVDEDQFRPPPGAVVRSRHELLRDHLSEMGIDPDTVDLDDPAEVRAALRQGR
ncbi:MAG TPA: hypothetical protein VFI47_27440 [Acidimicrobiales bacterium]|nr:hypothetical protein [Acidimicrobiales bacterium]